MSENITERVTHLNRQAAQLYRTGQPRQAIEIAIQVCDLAREHLDEQHPTYRTSLSNLAALHHSVGNYEAAKPLFEEVLRIERQVLGEQDPQVAATLNNLAVLCTEIGEYAEAESFYQQALAIRRAGLGKRDPAVARTLSDLANLYRVLGKYAKAESRLTEAIEIHRSRGIEESLDLARSLNALAVLHMTTGNYAKAKPLLDQSLEVRRARLGETHPDVAESLNNLAYLHQEQRNYSEATSLYQKARDIDRQVFGADHVRYAEDLNNLALVHYHIGNYAAARQLFEQALHIWQNAFKEEAHPQVARGLNNLAEVHLAMGDYRAAERLADQAAQIRRIVLGEENPNYAVSLTTLAKVHELTGNYTRAESLYEQARDIRKASQGENHPDFAESLNNLAALYHSMGKHKEAEVLWLQASDIWRRVSGEESTYFATSLNNLGALYREMGRYEEAERSYWQAYEIWHRIYGEEHILVATTLNNLGELYRDLGEYPEAEQLYTRARDTWQKVFGEDHPDYALCQNNLALLVAAAGQNDRALALMTEAAASDDRMIMQVFSISSESHRMAYISLLKGHLDTLLSLVMQSRADSSEGVGIALDLVLRRKAIVAEAFAVQRDAILGDRYPELEAELAKLTTLRGEIARNTLDGPGPEGVDAFKQLLVERHAQREQLEAELAQQIPEMELERKLRAADRAAIAEALPPGAALVEFVRFNVFDFAAVPAQGDARWKPARYAAFVLHAGKPNDAEMIDLGEARFIDEKVAAFRTSITGEVEPGSARGASDPSFLPDQVSVRSDQAVLGSVIAAATRHLRVESRPYEPTERTKLGVALRQMVFDQLKSALNGCTQLFLAPDSNLTRLPFEVLPLEEERYLIDASYQFSYLGVGRDVLRFGPGFTGHSTSPMVTADPDYDLGADNVSGFSAGKPFRRLGGTCQEGKEVAALLGVEPALEQQALESKLKACRSPSILHVATHGFFLPDASYNLDKEVLADSRWAQLAQMQNPLLRSGLALAGANTWLQQGRLPAEAEDGLLTAEDVTGMDLLSTELAVLSACETGLGEVQDGEGVFGLRRAFLLAGAKTLVMSLWKVPDQQTQELMVDFYQRILQGQPRAKALRQAQLAMKARHPDPFYWGAFICQGDPGSLLGTYRWERNGRGTC